MGDRIDPITPRPPTASAIPAIRRSDGSAEKRDREGQRRRPRQPAVPAPAPPPDDGRPHIDVRV
jgi:hypothetical protein